MRSNPIPKFDHNLVLPPHLGDPVVPADMSPYPCTTVELCQCFGTSDKRREILLKYLEFRARLRSEGITNGFQWLDGSFVEDTETSRGRAPNDIDVVTVYWGYDLPFQKAVVANFPEFANPALAKANFVVDHYALDAGYSPELTIENTRYWISLFSHSRLGVWKGMLKIDLDTALDDESAKQDLVTANK